MTHALLSASGAHRWMQCPGSLTMEAGKPDTGSSYAREGTAMHEIAADCLENDKDAAAFLGRVVVVEDDAIEITEEMCELIQVYLDTVREYRGTTGHMLVEQRVDYSHVLGVPDSFGTADCILIVGNTLIVIDLKTGYNRVDAEQNPQLQLYALGALAVVELFAEVEEVCLAISQPRAGKAPSEWSLSVADLLAFGERAASSARMAVSLMEGLEEGDGGAIADLPGMLIPDADACKYCKAKATCPALRAEVAQTVFGGDGIALVDDFASLDKESVVDAHSTGAEHLAACLSKVDLIEDWCAAIRKEAEARLHAGEPVPGFKLVQGKRGNRQWTDAEQVEQLMKSMRLKQDEMYDFKLISPTTAEKLLKESPRRWSKVAELITQSEGKPTVAPESDKRPALTITNTADEFSDIA